MELKDYIEKASELIGTQKTLAEKVGVSEQNLAGAKTKRRGLPAYACVKLAQLIGEDERSVIAASELVTEKNEERRAVWLPFVQAAVKAATAATCRKNRMVARGGIEPSTRGFSAFQNLIEKFCSFRYA